MFALQLLHQGQVALIHRVADRPAHIGRAPINDLILRDPMVSEHHALVWTSGTEVWVRDLGSSNGTSVNGKRVNQPVKLAVGDVIEVGQTELRVAEVDTPQAKPAMVLEETATGVCVPLTAPTIRVGGSQDCDLILADAPAHVMTLFHYPDGELWVGTDDGEDAIEPEAPFEAAGHQFVVRPATWLDANTVIPNKRPTERAVTLEASLSGPTGPVAVLHDGDSDTRYTVEAANRAILLYLLGKAVLEADDDASEADIGWVADDDLRRDIWGRKSRDNQLNVLLHRLRGELREAGIDPWFVEKKRKYTRARLSKVDIES